MRPPLPNRALLTVAALGCISVAAWLMLSKEPPHERLVIYADSGDVLTEDGRPIEDVTHYCLGCHDGTLGPAAAVPRPGGRGSSRSLAQVGMDLPRNHPVRATYPRGARGFYADGPAEPAIVLVNGEVTYIACHACNEIGRHRTVIGARDRFCLGCHDR